MLLKKYPIFYKTFIMVLIDCLFCWLSWIGSIFVFSYLFKQDHSLIQVINSSAWIILLASFFFNFVFGVYRSLWQHPGIGSIIRIITAVLFISYTMYIVLRLRLGSWPNPGLGMMAFYFLLTMSVGIRMYKRILLIVKSYFGRFIGNKNETIVEEPIKTLLIGAGDSASAFILNRSQQGKKARSIQAILDNDSSKHGYSLHGITIYGDDSKISEMCRRFQIEEIVIAIPSITNADIQRIVKLIPFKSCKVRLLTGLSADMSGERLREMNIGDLLGREEKVFDGESICSWIKDKTVLVTGGGGSIGSELCRQLLKFEAARIVVFDISENNAHNLREELTVNIGEKAKENVIIKIGSVQDESRLDSVFGEFKPSIVFHAAAYKHVPLMEECPRLAVENNVLGSYRTACCALKHGVERFVMISTDKAVNPTNVMGASKKMAELLVQSLNNEKSTEFVCVRFGNVLDSNGSVVPLFKRQIAAGGPVTITHPEVIRFFMTIPEAARLVLEAGAMAKGGEVFILDMGAPVKIVDLAENMIRMAGLTPNVDIEIEYTGLRPGEKLYEELLLDDENLKATLNDKIFVAGTNQLDNDERKVILEYVEESLAKDRDMRQLLKRFVPEFTQENMSDTNHH